MARHWSQGVTSVGKTLWLAMRRRARMLGAGGGPASSPTHHWDRGAKTWVARHSGETRQRCWRGSARCGNDQDEGLVSVVRRGPACTQTGQRVRGRVKTRAQRRVSVGRGSDLRTGSLQTWAGLGLDHVGLPGRPWSGRLTWTLGRMGCKA